MQRRLRPDREEERPSSIEEAHFLDSSRSAHNLSDALSEKRMELTKNEVDF